MKILRKALERMMLACGDWTAKAQVNATLESLAEEVHNFGQYQLGLHNPTPPLP